MGLLDWVERLIRWMVECLVNILPVKVVRHRGKPFLYRYHVLSLTNNGPGICIHHFVDSDPDRGYHDHPWHNALSFILCGRYEERILNIRSLIGWAHPNDEMLKVVNDRTPSTADPSQKYSKNIDSQSEKPNNDMLTFKTHVRKRWTFNFLRGENVYHRVMLPENKDAWTIFFFGKRSKTWGIVDLQGKYTVMSETVEDKDGGWWQHVMKGLGVHSRLKQKGEVIPTVDMVVFAHHKLLLIKRGKEPYKNCWAFPGGRIDPTDEDIQSAAKRELKEETHMDNVELEYVTTIGNKTRDPRGFTLTSVFLADLSEIPDMDGVYAGDDAVDLEWFDLDHLPEMAFDHKMILQKTLAHLNNKPILPEALAPEPTITEAEAIQPEVIQQPASENE